MSSYYTDIYSKRLNRYGTDFQTRLEGKRAKEFEDFLLKTPNRVDFEYEGVMIAGALEQYKQDYTEIQGYLLTSKEVMMPNGTIINFSDKLGKSNYWMIWWLEQIKTSGYHRYVILKMNYKLKWFIGEEEKAQWGYLSSPGTRKLRDSEIAGGEGAIIFTNNNLRQFITPYHSSFDRDVYIETENGDKISAYRVTEFDNQATEGVSYLSVEPIATKVREAKPQKTTEDKAEDFFWFDGGIK